MKKNLLIWDFDGVIADTEKLWLKNRQILLKEALGIDWDWETVNKHLRGTGDKTKRDVLDKLGIKTDDLFWEKSIEMDMNTMKNEGFVLTPYIEDIFKMPIKQCIATGGVRSKTAYKIEIAGIASYFPQNRIFTVDMVKHGKPEPDLFLLAAKSMGAEPQACVVIEDSLAGLTAALKAGMHPIAFLGGDLADNEKHFQNIKNLGISDIYHDMRDIQKRIRELF
jgi:HAD superfamily hydrolase (TIGR01509 family)